VLIISEKPTVAKKIADSLAERKLKAINKNDVEYYYLREMVNLTYLHQL
jgi:DNA topoisomerase IA